MLKFEPQGDWRANGRLEIRVVGLQGAYMDPKTFRRNHTSPVQLIAPDPQLLRVDSTFNDSSVVNK